MDWALEAARSVDRKGGTDTVVLEVGELLAITGAFVITSARNQRLVKAVVEQVEEDLALAGGPRPRRIEGLSELEWVLIDYGDFVVHVFSEEARGYYELERLWGDAPRPAWQLAPASKWS